MNTQELLANANDRIRENRTAEVKLHIVSADGDPIADAAVDVKLTDHAFKFGSNGFVDLTITILLDHLQGKFMSLGLENGMEQVFRQVDFFDHNPAIAQRAQPKDSQLGSKRAR